MNQKRIAEITQKFNGKGTDSISLYTNQEVVDKLKEVQKIMLEGVFEKTHAEHMRDRDILRHFSSLAEEYGLKDTEIFSRFEANMKEMGYMIGSYIKGMKGEQIAKRALKLLSYDPDVKILYNIALEDEDVQTEYDAIAITPYGVFVIEVKNWGDKMHIDEKGVLSREDQDITYDLADRMNIKEAMLKGCLGNLFPSKYQGFLLFPSGNVQIDDLYKKLVICTGAGIVDEIRAMKEFGDCLSQEQIEEIAKVLEANHSEQRSICTVKCEEIIHDYATIMTQIEEIADAKNQESEQHTEKVEAVFSSTYSKNEKEEAKQIEIPYFLTKEAKIHDDYCTAACIVTGLALVTGLGMLVKKTLSK